MPPWVGLTLTIVVCGGAFWKGDREQQVAAGGVLLSWLVTLVLRDTRWIGPQWGAFGADVANLALLTVISIRTKRYWPLVAAAFQLLCVMTHVARMLDPGVRAWAYASGQVIFTQLLLIAIGVGVLNTWRATRSAPRASR
jgi:hypothetical protein